MLAWQEAGCSGPTETAWSLRVQRNCVSDGEDKERVCVLNAHANFDSNL